MADSDTDRLARLRATLSQHHQSQLLTHWDTLSDAQRTELLDDIERINFAGLSKLIASCVLSSATIDLPADIQPAPFYPARPELEMVGRYADAVKRGESLIRQNKVAPFTVAGGQGTRLGFEGPKGAFPISPVKNKPLFRLFAELILGTNRRYGSDLYWYIMTSPSNDAATRSFFDKNEYFGLKQDHVRFFPQGVMPAFDTQGRILLDKKHRIAFSPDGHGGSLLAMRRSGVLAEMAELGIDHISYFQVDNPLVKGVDPLFIGLHEMTGSAMSSKTIPKADDREKIGNFIVGDGTTQVIEYSDLPDELARARDDAGQRLFDVGSIAIHALSRSFIEQLTADESQFGLPWHRAVKRVPYLDDAGRQHNPDSPNAIKLESFIFDAIRYDPKPLILQTIRSEEFSPLKNTTGIDSEVTARRDMNRRAAAWLDAAGFDVPLRSDGEPDGLFEISPSMALDADQLREAMTTPPAITPGQTHYWE